MTDQLATVLAWFAIALAAALLAWSRTARAWHVAVAGLAAACFVAAIALRTALLPMVTAVPAVVLVVALGAAIAARRRAPGAPSTTTPGAAPRGATPALVLCAAVAAGGASYAAATGKVTQSRPSLNPLGGYILIGVAAPILAPQDFAGTGVASPERLLAETDHRERSGRTWQVFNPAGLAHRLEAELGGWRNASPIAQRVGRRAILRDPAGFARLAAANARDYLDPAAYRRAFDGTTGLDQRLPAGLVQRVREIVNDDVTPDLPSRPSLVLSWTRAAQPSLPLVILLALALPVVLAVQRVALTPAARAMVTVAAVASWTYTAAIFALTTEVVMRYLLPLVPVVLVLAGLQVELVLARRDRARQRSSGGRAPDDARRSVHA